MKDLKFTACQLIHGIHLWKQMFEGLVTYSEVKTVPGTVHARYTFFFVLGFD